MFNSWQKSIFQRYNLFCAFFVTRSSLACSIDCIVLSLLYAILTSQKLYHTFVCITSCILLRLFSVLISKVVFEI